MMAFFHAELCLFLSFPTLPILSVELQAMNTEQHYGRQNIWGGRSVQKTFSGDMNSSHSYCRKLVE